MARNTDTDAATVRLPRDIKGLAVQALVIIVASWGGFLSAINTRVDARMADYSDDIAKDVATLSEGRFLLIGDQLEGLGDTMKAGHARLDARMVEVEYRVGVKAKPPIVNIPAQVPPDTAAQRRAEEKLQRIERLLEKMQQDAANAAKERRHAHNEQ